MLLTGIVLLLLQSCSRDPIEARKEHMKRAEDYFKGEQYKEAVIEYRNAIQADLRYIPAHYKLALAYTKTQNFKGMYEHLNMVVSFDHRSLEEACSHPLFDVSSILNAHLALAAILSRGEQDSRANDLLGSETLGYFLAKAREKLETKEDDTLKAMLTNTLFQKGHLVVQVWTKNRNRKLEELLPAVKALKMRIDVDRSLITSHLLLSNIAALAGGYLQKFPPAGEREGFTSVQDLLKEKTSSPGFAPPSLTLAKLYEEQAVSETDPQQKAPLIEKAQNELKYAFACNEHDEAKQKAFAEIVETSLSEKNQGNGVETALEKAAELAPGNPHLALSQGLFAVTMVDWENALNAFNKAQELYLFKANEIEPGSPRANTALARFYGGKQEFKKAEEILVKSVEANPDDVTPRLELASYYQTRARSPKTAENVKELLAKAEKQIKDAIALQPENLKILNLLARFYEGNDKHAEAEKIYNKMVKADPENPTAKQLLSNFYRKRRQPEKAISILEEAVTQSPEDLSLKTMLAALYMDTNKLDKAEPLITSVLNTKEEEIKKDIKKEKLDAQFLKGKLLFLKKDMKSASKHLDEITRDHPEHAGAHYYRGLVFLSENRIEEGKSALITSLGIDQNRLPAHMILARLYLQERDPEKALRHLDIVLKQNSGSYDTVILKGNAFSQQKKYNQAEEMFLQASELAPGNATAFYKLAGIDAINNKFDEALKRLDKVLELKGDYFPAITFKTTILAKQEGPSAGTSFLDTMIAQHADKTAAFRAALYHVRGNTLSLERKTQDAIKSYQKAIELNPESAGPYMSLARLYSSNGETGKAIARYKEIVENNPEHVQALMALAALYEAEKQDAEAARYYEQILSFTGDFPPAANNLAWMLLEQGKDPKRALELARTAQEQLPDNASVEDTFGMALLANGSNAEALHHLFNAVKRDEKNPVLRYHLGLAYYFNNNTEKGKELVADALKALFLPQSEQ